MKAGLTISLRKHSRNIQFVNVFPVQEQSSKTRCDTLDVV